MSKTVVEMGSTTPRRSPDMRRYNLLMTSDSINDSLWRGICTGTQTSSPLEERMWTTRSERLGGDVLVLTDISC